MDIMRGGMEIDMALITCRSAAFGYEGTAVISGLHFTVNRGDYLCIVGENGSGKSTLIRGLLRLLPPLEGEVVYGDGLQPRQIGYLPQQSEHQSDFSASVNEVVLTGRLNAHTFLPFFTQQDRAIAEENMELLEVLDLKKHCFRELSGGQQQRVLLARALCATRSLLLMDEPVTGLDPLVTAKLYQLIAHINRERGIAVVMVSHDAHMAVTQASHILHLGKTQLFFGERDAYLQSECAAAFLGGGTR